MLQSEIKPTFLVDAMLGNIAKKLRLLGYDSEYSSNGKDDELIMKAKNENRVLVTKDRLLSDKTKKKQISVICVNSTKEAEQLVHILKKLKVSKALVSGSTARCTRCNGKLEAIKKDSVIDNVPERILEKTDNFWKCRDCDKIYWEGTHIKRLQMFVDELNEKLR